MFLEQRIVELEERNKQLEQLLELHRTQSSSPQRMMEIIILQVASANRITLAEFLGPARPDWIVWPRQIAMFLARKFTGLPCAEIVAFFGRRDHGTVLHAVNVVKNRMATSPQDRVEVEKWIQFFEEKNREQEAV